MSDFESHLIKAGDGSIAKSADGSTDQLDERTVTTSIGDGVEPPYDPAKLAALQEANGTHAVAIAKKAKREVGFGFDIAPHTHVEEPGDEEQQRVRDFWKGPDTDWKLGPTGTPSATPVEMLEMARQDYHGIGWLALEVRYANFDDEPQGMSYLPAKTVRVKEADADGRKAGHGYVQKLDGQTRYFAEAGARHQTGIDGDEDPTYVDREDGETYDSQETFPSDSTPANEVLFIPNPHGNSLYYGIPTWVAEIQTIRADFEARRFNRERLANDAILDFLIIVENGQLSEQGREQVAENLKEIRKSSEPRAMTLESGDLADGVDSDVSIRVEPISQVGDRDMSFVEFREKNERDIAQAHEVPLQALSHQDATNANTTEALREFSEEVIQPNQQRFAERLYRVIHQQILDVQDWRLEFKTVGTRNRLRDAEVLSTVLRRVGDGLTINEIRRLADDVLDVEIETIEELEGELFGVVSDPILADELAEAVEDN
jgi:PBSX family phage portal protein